MTCVFNIEKGGPFVVLQRTTGYSAFVQSINEAATRTTVPQRDPKLLFQDLIELCRQAWLDGFDPTTESMRRITKQGWWFAGGQEAA